MTKSKKVDNETIEMEEEGTKQGDRVAGKDPTSLQAISSSATEEELELIYGAKHVIMLFVPVSLCMAVVIATISSVNFFSIDDGNYLVYTPFHPEEDDTGGRTLLKSVLNSLIILGVVVVMTFGLILLYKLRCYYVIHGWIILSSVMLLFMFGFVYLQELLKAYNVAMDLFSVVFCLFNFGVTGMLAIHWKGPLLLQQAYLILSASLMSLIFIRYMPEWTLWLVLALLALWGDKAEITPKSFHDNQGRAIVSSNTMKQEKTTPVVELVNSSNCYKLIKDLIAVLAPHGPLKMLVETAAERGEQVMPALIYSSTVLYPYITMAKSETKKRNSAESSSKRQSSENSKIKAKDTNHAQSHSGDVDQGSSIAVVKSGTKRKESVESPSKFRSAENSKDKFEDSTQEPNHNDVADPEQIAAELEASAEPPGESPAERELRRTSERIAQLEHDIEEAEERGVKLGLGDFIFYSVLVGKASASREPVTTIACFIGILMGLFLTLAILVTVKKALPALPISIFFGLIFNFGTSYLIGPMVRDMAANQIFI